MDTKTYNRFEFIGKLDLPSDGEVYTVTSYDSGWDRHNINLGIKGSGLDSQRLRIQAMHSKTQPMYAGMNTKWLHGEKGVWEKVEWDKRLDENVVEKASFLNKLVIDVEEDTELKEERNQLMYKINAIERKRDPSAEDLAKLKEYKEEYKSKSSHRFEFIHEYDFVIMLADVIDIHKDKTFRVTGDAEWSLDQTGERVYLNYIPKLIELVPDDTENKLEVDIDIYFHKNSIKTSGTENKVYLNGLVKQYLRDYGGNRLLPQQFVIDQKYIGGDSEQSEAMYQLTKGQFTTNSDKLMHLQCKVVPFTGVEQVVTKFQQDQLDLGIPEEVVFAGERKVVGDTVRELRISEMMSGTIFKDGAIEAKLGEKSLNELVVGTTINLETSNNEEAPKEEIVDNTELSEEEKLKREMEAILNGDK